MNIDKNLQEKILKILEKHDNYISTKILYEEIPDLDEKKLNGNIVFLEKEDKICVKVGVDNKNFKVKMKR
ncbi:hypothetical protein [Haliovirga abyssi]|uniref:Uncharacterized protein n=1 Tax=Haliovirga abyssi TaxID=2996794 RepID=A0AAU9DCE3_9FUSO|nr:hypothetical protein [Haliovirga abyssi]BDU49967.1 hypothetical protein HLVA_05360 [Haliovirga abyssi]